MSNVEDAGDALGSLENFARLTANLAHRFSDRARVLLDHQVDEAQLARARRAWRERLRHQDAEQLRARFYAAFDEAMSACNGKSRGAARVQVDALPVCEAFEEAPPPSALPTYMKSAPAPPPAARAPDEIDDTLPIPLSRQGLSAAPLPFVRSPREIPFDAEEDDSLTIEQFASSQAELSVWPDHAPQILAKYGLDDETKRRAVTRTWERRVSRDVVRRTHYAELLTEFRVYLARRKDSGEGPP